MPKHPNHIPESTIMHSSVCTVAKHTWLLLTILFLVSIQNAFAGGDGGVDDIPLTSSPITGSGLIVNAGNSITCPAKSNERLLAKITNIVSFTFIEETPAYITANFSATVKIKIEYGHSSSSLNTLTQYLTVSFNKAEGTKYNAKNYVSFNGAEYVRITVLEAPPAGSPDIRQYVSLQQEMRVTRYFDLPNTNAQKPTFNPPTVNTNASVPDELNVSWQQLSNAGNNAVQLEWTWLENDAIDNYKVNGVLNYTLLFKNNATRIDLPFSTVSYSIPLLYDGTGNLYYRARLVSGKENGSRSDGPWSTIQSYSFSGHSDWLNWQSTTSFAEEGKRKTVVQYFDGSLRSRQTVTKNNTDNTTVSAETFYDAQGRHAVQVLPAPGISTVIQYQQNLNEFNGQNDNTDPAALFDLKTAVIPPALKTDRGASQYYSAANPQVNQNNKNIPDAEGYPYTLTRYIPDGTGRILLQSGVGDAFKTGSGHETKYFYGTPSQEELDGLFGTEAGNYTHYFKNMVLDANRQAGVSYTDMHGRSIATALAGAAPAGMQTLTLDAANYSNQAGTNITRNLLSANSNIAKNNSIEAVNTLLVPAPISYSFRYALTPQSLQLTSCTNTQLCYNCMYDLEITITNESGDNAPIVRKFNNVNISADDNCSTQPATFQEVNTGSTSTVSNNVITFSELLQPGSYTVRKTLTVSETSLQKYKEAWITKGLCKSEQDIIDSVYNVNVTITGCNTTPPVINCPGNLCNISISHSLDVLKNNMLADMVSFSGQYAGINAPDPMKTPYSPLKGTAMYDSFNVFSAKFAGQPFYKNPWNSSKNSDYYKDAFGNKDPYLYPGGTGNILSSMSRDDFEQQFKSSWTDALLPHHPEYSRYLYALNNLGTGANNCYDWIDNFSSVLTYSQASANGYVFTTGSTAATPYNDPFYIKATRQLCKDGLVQQAADTKAGLLCGS